MFNRKVHTYTTLSTGAFKGIASNCPDKAPSMYELYRKEYTSFAKGTSKQLTDETTNKYIVTSNLKAKQKQDLPFLHIRKSDHPYCQDCRAKYIETCRKVGEDFGVSIKDDGHWDFALLKDKVNKFIQDNEDEKQSAYRILRLDECIKDRFTQNKHCYMDTVNKFEDLVVDPEHNEFITRLCGQNKVLKSSLLKLLERNKGTDVTGATKERTICTKHNESNDVLVHTRDIKRKVYGSGNSLQQVKEGSPKKPIKNKKAEYAKFTRGKSGQKLKRQQEYFLGKKQRRSQHKHKSPPAERISYPLRFSRKH